MNHWLHFGSTEGSILRDPREFRSPKMRGPLPPFRRFPSRGHPTRIGDCRRGGQRATVSSVRSMRHTKRFLVKDHERNCRDRWREGQWNLVLELLRLDFPEAVGAWSDFRSEDVIGFGTDS